MRINHLFVGQCDEENRVAMRAMVILEALVIMNLEARRAAEEGCLQYLFAPLLMEKEPKFIIC